MDLVKLGIQYTDFKGAREMVGWMDLVKAGITRFKNDRLVGQIYRVDLLIGTEPLKC